MTQGKFIGLRRRRGGGQEHPGPPALAAALEARGIACVVTREPGGTPGAEAIRGLLLGTEGEGWYARAEALLFASARSDHVERLISAGAGRGQMGDLRSLRRSEPRLSGGGGGLTDAEVLELHRIGSRGLLPDLTLLVEVSPEVARSPRRSPRCRWGRPGFGGRDEAYHAKVAAAFARFAEAEPQRFARIDGNGDAEAV